MIICLKPFLLATKIQHLPRVPGHLIRDINELQLIDGYRNPNMCRVRAEFPKRHLNTDQFLWRSSMDGQTDFLTTCDYHFAFLEGLISM